MIRLLHFGGRLPAVLAEADLKKTGRIMSKLLRVKRPAEVGVRFVTEREIQRLNRAFIGKNRPTDVLSFPLSIDIPRSPSRKSEPIYLGDIAICPMYAFREARRRAVPRDEELIRLLIHGILHLKGFDHSNDREETRMFGLQERAVDSITH